MPAKYAAYDPEPARRPSPFRGHVRRTTTDDAGAIADITLERHGGGLGDVLDRIWREVDGEWNGENGLVLVAEEDGRVLGFGRVRLAASFEDVEEELRPPAGWYLLGVVVRPEARRRGIARLLTRRRLEWIAERAHEAFYFVRNSNRASIDLHTQYGFVEHSRRFRYPRTGLEAGAGVLYRVALDEIGSGGAPE